jgi:hypothetical protein
MITMAADRYDDEREVMCIMVLTPFEPMRAERGGRLRAPG